jgi:hypothetical protein
MTDRELLELAAKAIGLPECGWMGPAFMYVKNNTFTDWDPLTNDGDAFLLAVKLRLDIGFEKLHTVSVWVDPLDEWITEQCDIGNGMGKGIEGLTRRAITRAAAEIGRTTT